MPFLAAGFNARNRDTGIVAWTSRGGPPRPAALHCFACGDYFWLGIERRRPFLTWGDKVRFRNLLLVPGIWAEVTGKSPWPRQEKGPGSPGL